MILHGGRQAAQALQPLAESEMLLEVAFSWMKERLEKLQMPERAPALELPQSSGHGQLHPPDLWRAQWRLPPLPHGASPSSSHVALGVLPEGKPTTPEHRQPRQQPRQAHQPASWIRGAARLQQDGPGWPSPPKLPPAPSSEALQLGTQLEWQPRGATRHPPP